jgi:hypothetical protein
LEIVRATSRETWRDVSMAVLPGPENAGATNLVQ